MRLLYNFITLCGNHNPDSTRTSNPALFGPGKGGWLEWCAGVVADIRKAKKDLPGVTIRTMVHMAGGALRHQRFQLSAPRIAHNLFDQDRSFLLGDFAAKCQAFRRIRDEQGGPLALYVGAPEEPDEDPVDVFDEAEGELAASGLICEYAIDATAERYDPSCDSVEPVPDPAIIRLFRHITDKYKCATRCEGWPKRHNLPLVSSAWAGVCVEDAPYTRSVQRLPAVGPDSVVPINAARSLHPEFLPRAQVGGTCLMVCRNAARDPIADARAWTAGRPLNIAAINLQGLHAANRSLRELVQPAEVMAT